VAVSGRWSFYLKHKPNHDTMKKYKVEINAISQTIEAETDEEFTAADQRIMIVIENGIIDTIFVEDELQTGNVPNIEIIDIDDQADDSVTKPDPHIILTTTEKFEKIRWA
jgi:hypothetical protein